MYNKCLIGGFMSIRNRLCDTKEIQQRIDIYNLDGICSLLNIIGETNDIKKININEEVFNDKTYTIEKEDDTLNIKCSDGRALNIKLYSYSWEDGDGYFDKWTSYESVVKCQYLLPSGNIITLRNARDFETNYDYYKKINPFEFAADLEFYYYIPNRCSIKPRSINFKPSWDFSNLEANSRHLNFTSDGIAYTVYHDLYLISQDGKRLLSAHGEDVLPLEEIKKFNIGKEQEKIEKILEENNSFHPYSIELLLDAKDKLKAKEEFVNKILKFYSEEIPLCQEVVKAREDIINRTKDYIFSEKEFLYFVKLLACKIENIYVMRKRADDLYNLPDERAKRLVKSLSEEDLNALKRQIK